MHCGVMVTGYNQGGWERLLAEDYSRPPAVPDATNTDDTPDRPRVARSAEPLTFPANR